MSLFDIFTAKPAEQAPAQNLQTPPGNVQDPATLAADSNVAPQPLVAPAQDPATPPAQDTPMAEYGKLWENKPNEAAPQAAVPLDQKAVQEVVAKTDFSSVIAPEHLAAISAGGEGAQQAFTQAMNAVAQQVMVQSTMVNNKLSEQAIEKAVAAQVAKMPELLRQQATTDHMKTANPLFSDPAIKPVAEATQRQLLQQFPNATQAEITDMTQNFLIQMGQAFAPKAPDNNGLPEGEQDWSKFI